MLASAGSHAACGSGDAALADIATASLPAFVAERFAKEEYDCGIRAVTLKAGLLGASQDPGAFHERFILRKLALSSSAAAGTPVAQRLALVEAAAATTQPTSPSRAIPDELKYDTMLVLRAAANFQRELETAAQLDALMLALQIDRLQPPSSRLAGGYDGTRLIPDRPARFLDRLTRIAELSQGDATASQLRGRIAYVLYMNFSARTSSEDFTATPASCAAIVRLVKVLGEIDPVRRQVPSGWQWRPNLEAAWCYRIAMLPAESRALVDEALRISRAVPEPDTRLSHQRYLLQDLIQMQHDRAELSKLASEMLATAKATDSAMAREVRERVTKIIADRLSHP